MRALVTAASLFNLRITIGSGPIYTDPASLRLESWISHVLLTLLRKFGPLTHRYKLDPQEPEAGLWEMLNGNSVGFAFQLRQRNEVLISRHGGWAKLPNDGAALWSQRPWEAKVEHVDHVLVSAVLCELL